MSEQNQQETCPFCLNQISFKGEHGHIREKGKKVVLSAKVVKVYDNLELNHVPPLARFKTVILDVRHKRYFAKMLVNENDKLASFKELLESKTEVELEACLHEYQTESEAMKFMLFDVNIRS